jgi:hypothetical protein
MQTLTPVGRVTVFSIIAVSAIVAVALFVQMW